METMKNILEELEVNTSIVIEIKKELSKGFSKIGTSRV